MRLRSCLSELDQINTQQPGEICECGLADCNISSNQVCYSPEGNTTQNNITGDDAGSVCMTSLPLNLNIQRISGGPKFCSQGQQTNDDGLCNDKNYCWRGRCYCSETGLGPCVISRNDSVGCGEVVCESGQSVVPCNNSLQCANQT